MTCAICNSTMCACLKRRVPTIPIRMYGPSDNGASITTIAQVTVYNATGEHARPAATAPPKLRPRKTWPAPRVIR